MAQTAKQMIMPVLGDPYLLDAQLEVPGLLVQIQHCRWPVLHDAKLQYSRDVLIQTLTPLPPHSMACLTPEVDPDVSSRSAIWCSLRPTCPCTRAAAGDLSAV